MNKLKQNREYTFEELILALYKVKLLVQKINQILYFFVFEERKEEKIKIFRVQVKFSNLRNI